MSEQKFLHAIVDWPEDAREAAQLVVDQYGEPDETDSDQIVWHQPGPWKRIVATRVVHRHNFPVPHKDSVESFIDYRVPEHKVRDLFVFDGSVVINRTRGEVSARCHDEQANFLALNLMHDIVNDVKTVHEAREYYAKEFLDYRRKKPTPYMEKLHFAPPDSQTADPDTRVLTDEDLEAAVKEGKQSSQG